MVIPAAVAYGVLGFVGLLVLVAFAVVFTRLEHPPIPFGEERQPMPLGWAIPPGAAVPSGVKPAKLRAASSRPAGS
jgi:hypothetical protein